MEVHLSNRVMRQFGLVQEIPSPFTFDATHFTTIAEEGKTLIGSWSMQWLPFWNHIDHYVCNAPIIHGSLRYDDLYLNWLRHITRFIIGNSTLRPQQLQCYVSNATAYEATVSSILGFSFKAY